MEQNNRYDRYREGDNRSSSNYDRNQDSRNNRDFDEPWNADPGYQQQSTFPGRRASGYNNQRGDYYNRGNDWQENNGRTAENNSYQSGQDYDKTYGNYQGRWGYDPGTNRDFYSGNYDRNLDRNQNNLDRNQNSNYRNYENRNPDRNADRNRYDRNDRGWWDRTSDEVSSWFGDDDAKRRRRMDHLNEGNHYGKGPKNYKRSEEKIKEDVNDHLSDDHFLDATDIDVEVNGTEVTLSGTVDSRHSKRRAEDLAEWVSGVTHVQNNLRVSSNNENNAGTPSENESVKSSQKSNAGNSGTSLTNTRTNKEQHLHN